MNNIGLSKEDVYKTLQNPSREDLINSVFNGVGEQDNLDFKENWTKHQKIAEIILGMANMGGGSIIVGIKENDDGTLEANGLEVLEDKEKLHSKIYNFLPDNVKFNIFDFDFTSESYDKIKGKMFQILIVDSDDKELPYVWRKNTDSAEEGCIFFRRGTKTVKANTQEIREMINKRIEAENLDRINLKLEEHLKQLQTLYEYIEPVSVSSSYFNKLFKSSAIVGISKVFENKNQYYPKENYDEFIAKMIGKKKTKIEKILDL